MIRHALQIIVAAITAAVLVFGAVLCVVLSSYDRRARAFVLVASLVLAGCAASTQSPVLSIAPLSDSTETGWTEVLYWNPVEFNPTTMHAYIFSLVVECTGIGSVADFFDIRWVAVDFLLDVNTLKRKLGGWSVPPPREILLDRRYAANDPLIVAHESIHDRLGGGSHEDPMFEKCEHVRFYPAVPR